MGLLDEVAAEVAEEARVPAGPDRPALAGTIPSSAAPPTGKGLLDEVGDEVAAEQTTPLGRVARAVADWLGSPTPPEPRTEPFPGWVTPLRGPAFSRRPGATLDSDPRRSGLTPILPATSSPGAPFTPLPEKSVDLAAGLRPPAVRVVGGNPMLREAPQDTPISGPLLTPEQARQVETGTVPAAPDLAALLRQRQDLGQRADALAGTRAGLEAAAARRQAEVKDLEAERSRLTTENETLAALDRQLLRESVLAKTRGGFADQASLDAFKQRVVERDQRAKALQASVDAHRTRVQAFNASPFGGQVSDYEQQARTLGEQAKVLEAPQRVDLSGLGRDVDLARLGLRVEHEPSGPPQGRLTSPLVAPLPSEGPSLMQRLTGTRPEVAAERRAQQNEASRAYLERLAQQTGIPVEELERRARGALERPTAGLTRGLIDSWSFGLVPSVLKALGLQPPAPPEERSVVAPPDALGSVFQGAGHLAGFLTNPIRFGRAATERLFGEALAPAATDQFTARLAKALTTEAATLASASAAQATGQTLGQSSVLDAAKVYGEAVKSGTLLGTVFGSARGVLPADTLLQRSARIGLGMTALDAAEGQHPLDERSFAQKAFDYGLNAFFLFHGQDVRRVLDEVRQTAREQDITEDEAFLRVVVDQARARVGERAWERIRSKYAEPSVRTVRTGDASGQVTERERVDPGLSGEALDLAAARYVLSATELGPGLRQRYADRERAYRAQGLAPEEAQAEALADLAGTEFGPTTPPPTPESPREAPPEPPGGPPTPAPAVSVPPEAPERPSGPPAPSGPRSGLNPEDVADLKRIVAQDRAERAGEAVPEGPPPVAQPEGVPTPNAAPAPVGQPTKPAPATWFGWQPGFGSKAGIAQWNLTEDIPGHPKGSTVSTRTLEALGYTVPPPPEVEPARQPVAEPKPTTGPPAPAPEVQGGEVAPPAAEGPTTAPESQGGAEERPTAFALPPDLAGAKPRFGFGAKNYTLDFASDLDRALFIVAQPTPSKRDADYMAALRGVYGDGQDATIRELGQAVRARVKVLVTGKSDAQPIAIPAITRAPKAVPAAGAPPAAPAATAPPSPPTAQPTPVAPTPEPKRSPEPHDYSSTQIEVPTDLANRIIRWAREAINPEDLAEDGIEQHSHLTLRYGLHGDDAAEVERAVARLGPLSVTLGRLDAFRHEGKPDVLIVRLAEGSARALGQANRFLGQLPHTETQPSYQPHVTVAYLKSGTAQKYLGMESPVDGQTFTADRLSFMPKEGEPASIPLGAPTSGGASVAVPAPEPAPQQAAPSPAPAPEAPAGSAAVAPTPENLALEKIRSEARRQAGALTKPEERYRAGVKLAEDFFAGPAKAEGQARDYDRVLWGVANALGIDLTNGPKDAIDRLAVWHVPLAQASASWGLTKIADMMDTTLKSRTKGDVPYGIRQLLNGSAIGYSRTEPRTRVDFSRAASELETALEREQSDQGMIGEAYRVADALDRQAEDVEKLLGETDATRAARDRAATFRGAADRAEAEATKTIKEYRERTEAPPSSELLARVNDPPASDRLARRIVSELPAATVNKLLANRYLLEGLATGEPIPETFARDLSKQGQAFVASADALTLRAALEVLGSEDGITWRYEPRPYTLRVSDLPKDVRYEESGDARGYRGQDGNRAFWGTGHFAEYGEPPKGIGTSPTYEAVNSVPQLVKDADKGATPIEPLARQWDASRPHAPEVVYYRTADGQVGAIDAKLWDHFTTHHPKAQAVAKGARRAVVFREDTTPVGIAMPFNVKGVPPAVDALVGREGPSGVAEASAPYESGDSVQGQTFMSEEPRAPYDPVRMTPPFFLASERVIEQKMPAAAFPPQVKGLLRAGGVKEDELKWSGIEAWLDQQGGRKVTKAEVLDYLRENNVRVEEVVKGEDRSADRRDFLRDEIRRLNEQGTTEEERRAHFTPGAIVASYGGGRDRVILYQPTTETQGWSVRVQAVNSQGEPVGVVREHMTDPASEIVRQHRRELNELEQGPATAKFSSYTLPGAVPGTYRELLLTLPVQDRMPQGWSARPDPDGRRWWLHDEKGTPWGAFGSREAAVAEGNRLHAEVARNTEAYRSPHWDEPNVLAHVRFDERQTGDSQRVLHIAEIQSDWGQSGRRQGFGDQIMAAHDAIRAALHHSGPTPSRTVALATALAPERRDEINRLYDALDAAQNRQAERSPVPPMPLAKTWQETMFRRVVRWAAEHGFDAVTWDTGATQADRYDLSKQVENLKVYRYDDGYVLVATPTSGGAVTMPTTGRMVEGDLERYVGKEVAERIVSRDLAAGETANLQGLDLKVGGEGMRGFYDKVLVDYADRFGKRWGVRAGETTIDTGRRPARVARDLYVDELPAGGWGVLNATEDVNAPPLAVFDTEATARQYIGDLARGVAPTTPVAPVSVHAFPITPAMRRSVLSEGVSLFAPRARYTVREGEDVEQAHRLFDEAARDLLRATDDRPLAGEKGPVPPEGLERDRGAERPVLGPPATGPYYDAGSGVRTLALALARDLADLGRVDLRGRSAPTADALGVLAQVWRDPRYETLRIVYTDEAGEILAHEAVTSRAPAAAQAFVGDPARFAWDLRDRMRRLGAARYYLLHNHPSTKTAPSEADLQLTGTIATRVPGFGGHVIIDHDTFSVIEPTTTSPATVREVPIPARPDARYVPAVPHDVLGAVIARPDDVAQLGRALQVRTGWVALLHRDSAGRVRAAQEMPSALFLRAPDAADFIRGQQRRAGAQDTFAFFPAVDPAVAQAGADLMRQGALGDIVVGRRSAMGEGIHAARPAVHPPIRVEESPADYRPVSFALQRDAQGRATLPADAAAKLAADLQAQGQEVEVRPLNRVLRQVWARPAAPSREVPVPELPPQVAESTEPPTPPTALPGPGVAPPAEPPTPPALPADEASPGPGDRFPREATRETLERLAVEAARMAPPDRQALAEWARTQEEALEREGRELADWCLENGGRFTIQ